MLSSYKNYIIFNDFMLNFHLLHFVVDPICISIGINTTVNIGSATVKLWNMCASDERQISQEREELIRKTCAVVGGILGLFLGLKVMEVLTEHRNYQKMRDREIFVLDGRIQELKYKIQLLEEKSETCLHKLKQKSDVFFKSIVDKSVSSIEKLISKLIPNVIQ